MNEDKLITKRQAANILAISTRGLDRLLDEHPDKISRIYIGKRAVRLRYSEVYNIMQNGIGD